MFILVIVSNLMYEFGIEAGYRMHLVMFVTRLMQMISFVKFCFTVAEPYNTHQN
jgi:hypothetical protein